MTSIDVGGLDSFPDGAVRIVDAGGIEVGIVRWAGKLYALSNVCTHQKGPVCAGVLGPMVTGGEIGSMDLDSSVPVIACPWHGWEFDVRTGRAVWDPRYRIRTYQVTVADGRVLVDVQRAAAPARRP